MGKNVKNRRKIGKKNNIHNIMALTFLDNGYPRDCNHVNCTMILAITRVGEELLEIVASSKVQNSM